MDALTLTSMYLNELLYSFTHFSRQNTDQGINHSIHAVHVASKAFNYHIQSLDRDWIRNNVLSHASVCKIEKL